MVLSIDNIGKRYGLLPSEVMSRASTFDLFVLDAALSYELHQHEKASGKKSTPEIPQEKLLEVVKRTRNKQ